MKDHRGESIVSAPLTAAAYKIVNQLQAPDLMGECGVSDKKKAIACQYVFDHWATWAQGAMMPSDLREIIDYWISRYDEVVTDA
jgi:hypothetical protein